MPPAQTTASEYLDARAARRLARLLNPAPVLSVHTPASIGRAQVERCIAQRFESVHGARVHDFMPALLTMGCGGRISAAPAHSPARSIAWVCRSSPCTWTTGRTGS